jgi:hypothetical protein
VHHEQEERPVSKDKAGRQSKTPKAAHNVKTKGQTPLQGSGSTAGASAVAAINTKGKK